MGRHKYAAKYSPKERLAKILKQSSNIPEVKEFREQCRDVFRLGGVIGLDEWIDARRELGLLNDRYVSRAADDLQGCLGSVIDAATIKPHPEPSGLTWEERLEQINRREEESRNNVRFVGTKGQAESAAGHECNRRFDKLLR